MGRYERPTYISPQKPIPAYSQWKAMNVRCEDKYKEKFPTYEGCEVSNDWLRYENFYDWIIEQKGYGLRDSTGILHNLDKDLIVSGNLVYSQETCVLLPPEINRFLVSNRVKDRELPLGISMDRGLFRAGYSNINLGRFETLDEAVTAYEKARKEQACKLANKWVDQIDNRAYNALINYSIRQYRNVDSENRTN